LSGLAAVDLTRRRSYNETAVRAKIFVGLFFLAPLLATAAVIRIKVDAPIHPITAEYIVQTIERADRAGDDLQRPGGPAGRQGRHR
jgi:hypothetical protein